ncbi:MAG: DNA repair and recombination protein RadB [Thermoplasmata archaeon]
MAPDRLPTGIASIDALLDGGLDTDGLTELYGEGGSGKTIVCLQITQRVALQGDWVLYIDTEGVSVARLEAVSQGRFQEVLHRLLLSTPHDLAEQTQAVESACTLARDRERRIGLIVLDSATFYYRLTLSEPDGEEGREALALELAHLLSTAVSTATPVLFTNQVWRNLTTGTLEPLGGSFVNHVAKTILRFDRLEGNRRRAVLLKHRSLPERSTEFRILSTGVE